MRVTTRLLPSRPSHRGPLARRVALGAGALALVSTLACGGVAVDGSTGVNGGGSGTGTSEGGGGGSQTSSALVGRWSRVLFFFDMFGSLHSSETEWVFSADGSAARTVITRNITEGFADATVAFARWQAEGNDVVITYQPPDAGTVRFRFRFESSASGTLLFLGETQFLRVSS